MQTDPRVFYVLALIATVVAGVVGLVFEPSFLSGLGTGISATFGLAFLVVGLIVSRLREQADALTAQMDALLGNGDLDLGALMSGFGMGGVLGGPVPGEVVDGQVVDGHDGEESKRTE